MSSSGEVSGGFVTGLGVVTGFKPALAAFLGFTAAFFEAAVVLGSAFSGFAFFSVAVIWGSLGALVTGRGIGLGVGVGEGVLAFTTLKKCGTLHDFACHTCAGAMLIFSVSFQF